MKIASSALLDHLRHATFERGKYYPMRLEALSLLVELEPGLFMRPLGFPNVDLGIIRQGTIEPETVHAFAALLAPGMTVLDVGANVGLFTLVAAHRVGPTGRVHAFEPTPELAAHIVRNLELNGLENIAVNPIAISDTLGHATLHMPEPDDPGENSIVYSTPGARTREVFTVTLDDYVDRHRIGRVDVIKIDIAGAEMLALHGAAGLLSGDGSPVLVMELRPTMLAHSGLCPDDMLELLASYGYAFYPIAVDSAHTHDSYLNGIAAKPGHFDGFPALSGGNSSRYRAGTRASSRLSSIFPSYECEKTTRWVTPCRNLFQRSARPGENQDGARVADALEPNADRIDGDRHCAGRGLAEPLPNSLEIASGRHRPVTPDCIGSAAAAQVLDQGHGDFEDKMSTLEFEAVTRSLGHRHRVNPMMKIASSALLGYLRTPPFERGKYRLMRLVGPSLLVELEPDLFMRPLGLSNVEVGIIRQGMFEPETVHAFAALLAPGMTVLDVGANVGLFTLVAAHRVGPAGRVHAFEPTPELAAHIVRNLELNGLENIAVNPIAVSDTLGHATLHMAEPDDPGENSIVNSRPAHGHGRFPQ